MICYCTYFDKNYLPRGLSLLRSLQKHSTRKFHFWVLCLDEITYSVLQALNLPDLILVAMPEFEKDDRELKKAKENRSLVEYYWTCTPSLPLYITNHNIDYEWYVYLDADQFFFEDPELSFIGTDQESILLVEHRFPPKLKHLEENGRFNVGFLAFRKDAQGLSSLKRWRAECLEWCYYRHEDGKFGDQKYLDPWPDIYPRAKILGNHGIGLAPWNISQYILTNDKDDRIWVNNETLILYHFHGLNRAACCLYSTELETISGCVRSKIYRPYLKDLLKSKREIESLLSYDISPLASLRDNMHEKRTNLRDKLSYWYGLVREFLKGKFIVVVGNYVW